ncbi:MAG: ornithine cyclodeaminase family protein [Gammaproteobacteria bacterium]
MQVTVIGHREVVELLPMADCVEVMAGMFQTLGRGEAIQPLRQVVRQPDRRGALGLMPSYLGAPPALGAKVVSVFPGNAATCYESHQGAVLLFETGNGRLLAIIDAGAITSIRTAAVSALATRLLAREEGGDLAILGAGTQANMHLAAMQTARQIKSVRVWSRDADHARRFAETTSARYGLSVTPTANARDAVTGADIICTVTGAKAPILQGEWIVPGTHINAVGASVPPFRELDTDAVVRSRVFVDRKESALAEADDLRIPLQEKAIAEDHIRGELADLALERVIGRTGADDITLFKSVGLAVEDLAAAQHVYERAVATGAGTQLDFSAERNDGQRKPEP